MRTYYDINLKSRSIESEVLEGEQVARAGRYLIAKKLVEGGYATVDPHSPENPLIFSAGPLAGTTYSNANRTSVGCKSPLTGGIKEANAGGTFSYGLGQLHIAGFTLHDVSDDWTVIHFHKDGTITFDDAADYLGKGNFETAEMLFERYGKKTALAICGPVGEYQGLLAGVAFSDSDGRPSRFAARGGVGAVMGHKKVKAIVADLDKVPELHDRKKTMENLREYARKLRADSGVMKAYNELGTMGTADYINHLGGLPVRNFSSGKFADESQGETFKMGAAYIGPLNISRGGSQTHACMPGCVIQCSNVYFDAEGKEVVSPVEYETLGVLGTNCGIGDPDELAALNAIANDLGIDTIETGGTLGVLMDAGLGAFGDVNWMIEALYEIRMGTENGRIWAQGTAHVGTHYGVERVPVIKKQAISAYDPRVIETTGVTMMVTAQGADHTAGNVINLKTREMEPEEILAASHDAQVTSAAQDSLGLCIFGRAINNAQTEFIVTSINDALGTELTEDFYREMGQETLDLEWAFNRAAGFVTADDDLPDFFYSDPLPPTNHIARFRGDDLQAFFKESD